MAGGDLKSDQEQREAAGGAAAAGDAAVAADLAAESADFAARMGLQALDLPAARRGRPRGSKNRAPEQTRALIRQMGGDPLLAAAQIVAGGPALVMRLACQAHQDICGSWPKEPLKAMPPAQAVDQWRKVVEFLAPYLGQKLPLDVNITGSGWEGLQVAIFAGQAEAAGPDLADGAVRDAARAWSLPSPEENPEKTKVCAYAAGAVTQDAVTQGQDNDG